jgi:uncharacterized heparinase superfamily protein
MTCDIDENLNTANSYLFAAEPPATNTISMPYFASRMVPPSAGRYWRTLRHLRASQIFYLVRHRVLGGNDIGHWPEAHVAIRAYDRLPKIREWQPGLARQIIRTGDVRFDERVPRESENIPWYAKEIARRQMFHANYCDFLNVDLSAPEESELLHRAIRITLSWCDQNPTGTEVGWHPFLLSLRIVNWLKFLVRNADHAEKTGYGAQIDQILVKLRIQVLSLESRLERELLANHLLKNAKALVFAGTLLEAPERDRWRVVGEKLLLRQIAEQILPDGGHIERSPMYHAWILDHMLDIRNLFDSCPSDVPECAAEVSNCIERMARYLGQITHPDGEIPLLNDSQLGVTRPTAQILEDAGAYEVKTCEHGTEVQIFRDTGYAVIRDLSSQSFLIFDCGRLGPDYQPGHGHSDVLSYELTLHRQRVIVDTGVSSYEPSPERYYERSTAAHNTIRVDGSEQAEIWGNFRVGRRPSVSRIRHGQFPNAQFVQGAHFGYRHLGVVHSRAIVHLGLNSWVFVDRVSGKGSHKLESFIHFYPTIGVRPIMDSETFSPDVTVPRWSLEFGGLRYVLMTFGDGTLTQAEAWYSPGFAIRLSQSVIHWTREGELPATILYAVVPEGTPPIAVSRVVDPAGIEINHLFIPMR